jgi:hypothetical protein
MIFNLDRIQKINWPVYKIVSDGAMSIPSIAEGRVIPGLILDTNQDLEIRDLIEAHDHSPPGDAEYNWSTKPFDSGSLYLTVEFKSPIPFKFSIYFEIPRQNFLVDGVLKSRGFYLLAGSSFDKVSNLSLKRIMCEVPDTGFSNTWESINTKSIIKRYRKQGLSKKEAERAAKRHIDSSREIWRFRQGDR